MLENMSRIVTVIFILILSKSFGYGQEECYQVTQPAEFTREVSLLSNTNNQLINIKDAKLLLSMDFGDDYKAGNYPFVEDVYVKVIGELRDNTQATIGGSSFSTEFYLNLNHPEQTYYKDITASLQPHAGQEITLYIKILGISGTDVSDQQSVAMSSFLASNLRMCSFIDADYGIDVNNHPRLLVTTSTLNSQPVNTRNSTIRLDNSNHWLASKYQLQILKIYNESKEYIYLSSPLYIKGSIDWDEALNIEVKSNNEANQNFIDISFPPIIEGTGYYIWRIRPIGSLYEGGASNPKNINPWSFYQDNTYGIQDGSLSLVQVNDSGLRTAISTAEDISISVPNECQLFYFADPDHDLNWTYYRAFTEDLSLNTVTYADPLNRIIQTQVKNETEDQLIVNSTLTDLIGRNTINFLPVPIDQVGGIESYIPGLVKVSGTQEDFSYKNFDTNEKLYNPDKVKDSDSPYSYYNGQTNMVADAQEVPYARTIYEPDGSGRIRESSGPGEEYSLSYSDDIYGKHTARVLYGNATEAELIALFGKEAPLGFQVKKTISIDANNTMSITYTSAEGNVIATSLAVTEAGFENPELLPIDDLPIDGINHLDGKTTDIITQNTHIDNGLYSGKRYVFTEVSDLELSYAIECSSINAGCVDLSCTYLLKLEVKHLEDLEDPLSNGTYYASVGGENCSEDESTMSEVSSFYQNPDLSGNALDNNGIITLSDLPVGTYMIEKTLYLSDENGEVVSDLSTFSQTESDQLLEEYQGFSDLFNYWMETPDGEVTDELLFQVANKIIAWTNGTYDYGSYSEQYFFPSGFPSIVTLDYIAAADWPSSSVNFDVQFSSDCCEDNQFNLIFDQISQCPEWTFLNTDGDEIVLDDLWCKLTTLLENEDLVPAEYSDAEAFASYLMLPYTDQTFKDLIENMLSVDYACTPGGDLEYHYELEQVIGCWQGTINFIEAALQGDANDIENPFNLDNDSENGQGEGEQNIEDNVPFFIEWFINPAIEDAQNEEIDLDSNGLPMHPMVFFFDCVGHQFETAVTTADSRSDYYNSASILPGLGLPGMGPIASLSNAHRYFIYDDDCESCEYINCYDPIDCDNNPNCSNGEIGHTIWNCNEWNMFFYCLKNGCPPPLEEFQEVPCPDLYTYTIDTNVEDYDIYLRNELLEKITTCQSSASDLSNNIQSSLTQQYLVNDWQIVSCLDDNSPENFITTGIISDIADDIIQEIRDGCISETVGTGHFQGLQPNETTPVLDDTMVDAIYAAYDAEFLGCAPSRYCSITLKNCFEAYYERVISWDLNVTVQQFDNQTNSLQPIDCNTTTNCDDPLISSDVEVSVTTAGSN